MKVKAVLNTFLLMAIFSLSGILVLAQEQQGPGSNQKPNVADNATTQKDKNAKTGDQNKDSKDSVNEQEDIRKKRQSQLSEEDAAIVPYYNNFLANYYLGPEDVISVEVFGLDRYSRRNITVPPNGKITLPLIREVSVVGKTTDQVADEVTKRLEEYVIDPKVSVSLDRAMSARYSVLGDVGQPGIKIMSRRLSVYEAIAEAGGILSTGDKKNVVVLRRQADGNLIPIPINVKDIEIGKSKQVVYLAPGDQIVVQGKRIGFWGAVAKATSVLSFARLFGVPVP